MENTIDDLTSERRDNLARAINLAQETKIPLAIYQGGTSGVSYTYYPDYPDEGLMEELKVYDSDGKPRTKPAQVTQEKFLSWVAEQPSAVQQEVDKTLETYTHTETPH